MDLQVRYYFKNAKREIPTPLLEGFYIGIRAKLNSSTLFIDQYITDPELRFMSTTQIHPNIGMKRYFSKNKLYIDLAIGVGTIINHDFKTHSFNSNKCFIFGFKIF